MPFADRRDAGHRLADALHSYKQQRPVILALPRGGVPVAAEVAKALGAPLDLLIVRKIGAPSFPELAMGAVVDGEAPIVVRNDAVIAAEGVTEAEFLAAEQRELAEIRRRRERYVGDRPHPPIADRTAIIIDDGIATGATVRAAIRALRQAHPKRIVVAVPVAAADTLAELRREADEVICLEAPEAMGAIGYHYRDFAQVGDEEVIAALAGAGPR
ncbi:MAG: phosphoribosyltransferase [Devosia nanyangense]|uniref:Phosphoribosyltransferase n=1 Tax=Devosia nanyangense TaxID=1228055 RepID=A0A933NYB1_9HYPH|nr:phosphoribosyltransferase [Devosia nanyangense]